MQTKSCLTVLLSITLFAACGKEAKIAQPAGAASAPTNDPSAEVVCSSMQDYESGLKYGLKTAPLCDIVKTDLKKCIGEYSKENWTNCLGERNMPDGSRYLGGYLDGKANGKGEFINKDGTRYIGYYLNGQRHGEGKEYSAAGIIEKTGKWINGIYDSNGQNNQNLTAEEKAVIEQFKATKPQPQVQAEIFKLTVYPKYVDQLNRYIRSLKIQAVSDDVELKELKVNKGNCQTSGLAWEASKDLPQYFKYGQILEYFVDQCDVLEVYVNTNLGSKTYYWK